LHVLPPHNPYLPPKPYMGIFGDSEKFNTLKKQWKLVRDPNYESEMQADVDILRKRYNEFILHSDKEFELFMSRLPMSIDKSNTIIILTSDHGESFSHGYLGHRGPDLYESLTHIPLIIKMPDGTENRTIDIPAEQIDIAPTILDLAGIPIPSWMEGRSLSPLLQGKTLASQPVFSMQFRNNHSLDKPITKGTIAVWEGDYKLIYYLEDEKTLLFNLKDDHNEKVNLYKHHPEITRKLTKLITDNLSLANQRIKQLP
jgi:arylsulfatase A-like enzyme